jgi:hypothetical protein
MDSVYITLEIFAGIPLDRLADLQRHYKSLVADSPRHPHDVFVANASLVDEARFAQLVRATLDAIQQAMLGQLLPPRFPDLSTRDLANIMRLTAEVAIDDTRRPPVFFRLRGVTVDHVRAELRRREQQEDNEDVISHNPFAPDLEGV